MCISILKICQFVYFHIRFGEKLNAWGSECIGGFAYILLRFPIFHIYFEIGFSGYLGFLQVCLFVYFQIGSGE